jgi:hypothetical protein
MHNCFEVFLYERMVSAIFSLRFSSSSPGRSDAADLLAKLFGSFFL